MRALARTAALRGTRAVRQSQRWRKYAASIGRRRSNRTEEVTELVGLCLWDVFSDNHDVIAADGRVADIGSFRGAGAFLDEHLTRGRDGWQEGNYLRFYLGMIWTSRRAELTPVYAMIFRRLRSLAADWVYHFPELYLTELVPSDSGAEQSATYSVSQSAAAELKAQKRCAETPRFRAGVEETNARAREEALDRRVRARSTWLAGSVSRSSPMLVGRIHPVRSATVQWSTIR